LEAWLSSVAGFGGGTVGGGGIITEGGVIVCSQV